MDLCLTARMMDAAEAEKAGLVACVIPADKLVEEALAAAATIASYSLPVIMMIMNPSTAASNPASTRACSSSAACSTPASPWTTRRKAWPPSSRSARPSSRTSKFAVRAAHDKGLRPLSAFTAPSVTEHPQPQQSHHRQRQHRGAALPEQHRITVDQRVARSFWNCAPGAFSSCTNSEITSCRLSGWG